MVKAHHLRLWVSKDLYVVYVCVGFTDSMLMDNMLDRWCPRSSSDQSKTRYGRYFGVDPTLITRTSDLILHYRSGHVSISSSTLGMGFKKSLLSVFTNSLAYLGT